MNLNGVFHYKPSIFWGTPFFGNTHISYKYMIRWKWNQDEPVFVLHCWHRRGQDFQPDDFPPTKKKRGTFLSVAGMCKPWKPHAVIGKKNVCGFFKLRFTLVLAGKGLAFLLYKGYSFSDLDPQYFHFNFAEDGDPKQWIYEWKAWPPPMESIIYNRKRGPPEARIAAKDQVVGYITTPNIAS